MESIHTLIQTVKPGAEYAHLVTEPGISTRLIKRSFELYCRWFLFRVYCPVTSLGREHLPAAPYLLCSNHCSHMDSVALMIAAGKSFDGFGMMAAMDYFFENKTRKLFLNEFMNLIPIKRQPNIREVVQAIVACRDFMKAGNRSIILFPEGTRSPQEDMLPFKKGAAMIAIELGIPIVPAYINGTKAAMPKGRGIIKPGRIAVHIGKALEPEKFIESNCNGRFNKSYRYMTQALESRIHHLEEIAGREN